MAEHHNYIVIIGRAHGDDEDHARNYGDMPIVEARQAFINDVRRDEGIPEDDIVAGYEYTNVYITQVLTSQSPINVNEED